MKTLYGNFMTNFFLDGWNFPCFLRFPETKLVDKISKPKIGRCLGVQAVNRTIFSKHTKKGNLVIICFGLKKEKRRQDKMWECTEKKVRLKEPKIENNWDLEPKILVTSSSDVKNVALGSFSTFFWKRQRSIFFKFLNWVGPRGYPKVLRNPLRFGRLCYTALLLLNWKSSFN